MDEQSEVICNTNHAYAIACYNTEVLILINTSTTAINNNTSEILLLLTRSLISIANIAAIITTAKITTNIISLISTAIKTI